MKRSTYDTLLDICEKRGIGRRPIDIAAYLTLNGYRVGTNTLGNWKSRGIPPSAQLKLIDVLDIPSHALTDPDWQPATVANPFPSVPNPTNGCPPLTLEDVIDYFVTLDQAARDKLIFTLNTIHRANLTSR